MNKYLSFKTVLEVLPEFSERYLRYLVATKQIPHIKPTKRKLLFDPDEIDRWLKERSVKEETIEVEETNNE